MHRASIAAAACMAVLATGVSRPASASEARTSSLSWLRMPGSESCIATQALARSVEERLGRRVFVSAAEADVSVEGRIEKRSAGGWHSVITIRDGTGALLGTRELDRPEGACSTMNEPLALVIAVMIDPEAKLSSASSPPPLPPPTPAPAPAPAPVATHTDVPTDLDLAPRPKPPEPWRFQGDAVATVTSGIAPTVDAGGSIAGTLFLPRGIPIGLRGYGSLFLPTKAEQDGARASFDLFYLGSAICPTMRRPAVTLMLCFGGHLGVLRSHPETQGRNIEDKTEVIWNAVSEGRITVPLFAPLALTGGISAVLPLLRPTFGYTRSDAASTPANLHKVSSFAVAADAGIGFFFP